MPTFVLNWKMKLYRSMKNSSLLTLVLLLLACKSEHQQAYNESSGETTILPYYQEASFTPSWFDDEHALPNDFHKIPEFSLTNHLGETITEETVRGKIYVVDFFFASCSGICPKLTSNMAIVQDAFLKDDDVLLLSHSVTPTLDTVRALKAFSKTYGVVDGKWHLLTGDRDLIYDLGRNYYFVEEDLGLEKNPDEFIHTENMVLIDQDGYIRGIYNGLNKTSIDQLIEDIHLLKTDTSRS